MKTLIRSIVLRAILLLAIVGSLESKADVTRAACLNLASKVIAGGNTNYSTLPSHWWGFPEVFCAAYLQQHLRGLTHVQKCVAMNAFCAAIGKGAALLIGLSDPRGPANKKVFEKCELVAHALGCG